ncbi:MAG: nitrous oxide reductase accessory protein NosL [Planctomycetes bacterium]|nr:nitrous oxide reductase accessory protein NosL [Planctomycetota bacterium]MCC7061371.1 nitrous oxide reductase accessory protein NosL [Planctomycetota bacterium]
MSRSRVPILPLLLLGAVVAAAGGAVTYSVLASAKMPDGPFDVVWDKTACSACGMHVGEPGYAAQLTTKDGRTHAFDDPGCLFLYLAEQQPQVHSMFFHHRTESRWLARDKVAFQIADKTPMGFGLAAVDGGARGAIGFDEAGRKCRERTTNHGGK